MKTKIVAFLARSLFDFPSNLISDFFFLLSLVLIHKYLRTFRDLFDIRFYTFTIHLLFNKLTSVFYASVLSLTINCIITLSVAVDQEPQASGSAVFLMASEGSCCSSDVESEKLCHLWFERWFFPLIFIIEDVNPTTTCCFVYSSATRFCSSVRSFIGSSCSYNQLYVYVQDSNQKLTLGLLSETRCYFVVFSFCLY